MSIISSKANYSPLTKLHKITEELQDQLSERHAHIFYLPESEIAQELKNSHPKLCHARFTHPNGLVSKHIKMFQKHIDQKTFMKEKPL